MKMGKTCNEINYFHQNFSKYNWCLITSCQIYLQQRQHERQKVTQLSLI